MEINYLKTFAEGEVKGKSVNHEETKEHRLITQGGKKKGEWRDQSPVALVL